MLAIMGVRLRLISRLRAEEECCSWMEGVRARARRKDKCRAEACATGMTMMQVSFGEVPQFHLYHSRESFTAPTCVFSNDPNLHLTTSHQSILLATPFHPRLVHARFTPRRTISPPLTIIRTSHACSDPTTTATTAATTAVSAGIRS
jgi:hypothetical protein